jgi:16S rRNA (guanine(966)-N(2))-methyltransferase RsmD
VTRIIAGVLGGRRLAVPPGQATRPTSDRVREALFSTLETLTDLAGCRFADLYAGSGAVGLEAASRGAAAVLLVESEARAARTIRRNIADLGLAGTCALNTQRVSAALAEPPKAPYDVVFADPPYTAGEPEIGALLTAVTPWLAPGALVVLERSSRTPTPAGLPLLRTKRYGESVLHYFRV